MLGAALPSRAGSRGGARCCSLASPYSCQYGGGGGYGGGGYSGGSPLGDTHEQRMQAIQNFGAQNTQNFEARMNQMDASHSNWMQSQGYAH